MSNSADDNEKTWLKKALKASSEKAFRENKALNISTLVARNGKLIRINGNGEEEIVGESHKPVKINKKEFRFSQ